MSRKSLAAVLGTALVVVLALLVPGGLGAALHLLIALPLVLVLPGYAVTATVFPRRQLGVPETIVFSLGLSLALLALAGLALSLTPWGMGTIPWGIFLGIMAMAAAGVARRDLLTVARSGRAIPLPAARTVLPFAAAALIVFAALRIAIVGEAQQPQAGFTQLWILPSSPSVGNATTVRLGITSREPVTRRYIVQLAAGGHIIRRWSDLSVAPGQTWRATVPMSSGFLAGGKVEATLSRATSPRSIYRRVWLERDT